jgi:hypothetical protein
MRIFKGEAEEDEGDKVMNENEAGETRDCFWFYDEPCCVCYDIPDEGYGDFNWIYYVKETCNVCG